jgi:thiol-disulfide isomerase/thioredoxin
MRHVPFRTVLATGFTLLLCLTMTMEALALTAKGDVLPAFPIVAPRLDNDQQYLGVTGDAPFTLADVKADLIMVEFMGVYCPICHEQAPGIRKMLKKINKDATLKDRFKLIAIAGGATALEVDHVRKQYKAKYPIIEDPDFSVHKVLGEPKTPFTVLMRPDGTVLYAHLGIIKDFNAFLKHIKSLM